MVEKRPRCLPSPPETSSSSVRAPGWISCSARPSSRQIGATFSDVILKAMPRPLLDEQGQRDDVQAGFDVELDVGHSAWAKRPNIVLRGRRLDRTVVDEPTNPPHCAILVEVHGQASSRSGSHSSDGRWRDQSSDCDLPKSMMTPRTGRSEVQKVVQACQVARLHLTMGRGESRS